MNEKDQAKRIFINVGGKLFETTKETLRKCRKLNKMIQRHSEQQPFLDRDPVVFDVMLKFLRGYPIGNVLKDKDLLHELIYWQHEFIYLPLPECIEKCSKEYSQVQELINLMDQDNLFQYKSTHILVPIKVAKLIFPDEILPSEKKPVCDVVCTAGWEDHVWIERSDFLYGIAALRFKAYTHKIHPCVCGKCPKI